MGDVCIGYFQTFMLKNNIDYSNQDLMIYYTFVIKNFQFNR